MGRHRSRRDDGGLVTAGGEALAALAMTGPIGMVAVGAATIAVGVYVLRDRTSVGHDLVAVLGVPLLIGGGS